MADVFISYAREDLACAEALAKAVTDSGYSVWLDRGIVFGDDLHEVIESQIAAASVVIVLWSAVSKRSDWVRDEASDAKEGGKYFPVMIEEAGRPPYGFGTRLVADLSSWQTTGFGSVLEGLRQKLGIESSTDSSRPEIQTTDSSPYEVSDWRAFWGAAPSRIARYVEEAVPSKVPDTDDWRLLWGSVPLKPPPYSVESELHARDEASKSPGGGTRESEEQKSGGQRGLKLFLAAAFIVVIALLFREINNPSGRSGTDGPEDAKAINKGSFSVPDLKLKEIPKGSFQMGSETGFSNESPVRSVEISSDFWMSATEITVGQWKASGVRVEGVEGPDLSVGENVAVTAVSWDDAQSYVTKLNQNLDAVRADLGLGEVPGDYVFRLPTEAEWEYACRAGTTTPYSFEGGEAKLSDHGWFGENSGWVQAVGLKPANAWGLHDMHGNVWEWCQDWYDSGYYGSRPNPNEDPQGPATGVNRVVRGGSWNDDAGYCRSAYRGSWNPGGRYYFIGFRVVLVPPL